MLVCFRRFIANRFSTAACFFSNLAVCGIIFSKLVSAETIAKLVSILCFRKELISHDCSWPCPTYHICIRGGGCTKPARGVGAGWGWELHTHCSRCTAIIYFLNSRRVISEKIAAYPTGLRSTPARRRRREENMNYDIVHPN